MPSSSEAPSAEGSTGSRGGRWTAADIRGQSGRTAIVTGANSGLGFVAARELARSGARVVLACRDRERGQAAMERIRQQVAGAQLELQLLDLAELSSVREFAARVADESYGIDLLINNAGVMAIPRRVTSDGFEMQLAVNHLGHFALTALLLPQLLERPDPRVVAVSSVVHRIGRIRFGDLHGERRYRRWDAYSQAKLANLMFAYELQRRAEAAGSPLKAVAAHPGWSATELQFGGAKLDNSRLEAAVMRLVRAPAQPAEIGALSILYAACAPDVAGGSYVGPGGPLELRGYPKLVGSSAYSRDREAAERLWQASEELSGVQYRFSPVASSASTG